MQRRYTHHLSLNKCIHQTEIMGSTASVPISHNDYQSPDGNNLAASLPYKYEYIIHDAEIIPNKSELRNHLRSGIFLNQGKHASYNCFMLFPRDLNIAWDENKKDYGKFDTSILNPGVKYEVVFLVMFKNCAYGWEEPVNLKLVHSGSETQLRKEYLDARKLQWMEVQVGEFETPPQPADERYVRFSLFDFKSQVSRFSYESQESHWRRGLLIKGVIIRPKK
ncbi:hypothetical protein MKX03_023411 [Papaver bracteatum]|nr:hypothetical protein MKX03_023411 [Papaver bracteatum]